MRAPIAGYPVLRNRIAHPIDIWLEDGARLPVNPEWRVIYTPGHVEDSICFYHESSEVLLSGDTIINITGRGELNPFNSDQEAIFRSFEKLKELKVSNLYPGHGRFLEKDNLWEGVLKLSMNEMRRSEY